MNETAQKYNVSKGRKRQKPSVTRDYLLRATYSYLQRFATTEKNLRDVLERKVLRRLPDTDSDELHKKAKGWIEEIIDKALQQNLVNDQTFAEGRAASLIRSGNSKMKTAQKLLAKGVAPEMVEDVIGKLAEEHLELDKLAAVKYARKRRFGPFSLRHDGEELQDKELASMCRAGFSYGLARETLLMSKEVAEEIIYGSTL